MTSVLDDAFRALSDPTRRLLLERLGDGPASVSELAEPLPITLAAVVQHVQVLETGGLITTRKTGRVRTCTLRTATFEVIEQWLGERRSIWHQRLDRLDAVLDEQAGR